MIKKRIYTLGLVFITFLAAIQYIFLQNVPSSVTNFSFITITNIIGFVILGIFQAKKMGSMKKHTLLKGAIFALELTGFNFFMLIGSKNLDSVIISSVISLYFVFVTPIMLLLKKKVNFLSGIATVLGVIALLLMFGADIEILTNSVGLDFWFLIIADIFFAIYVVSVAIMGEGEDSMQLTLSQMLFSVVFGLVGWVIEVLVSHSSFYIPTEPKFWISAIFIGVFIRAIYGIVQISCQKHVPAITASLIFSAEIIITLVLNPVMCRLFNTTYTKATVYQVIGCVLFVVAALILDDGIMSYLGYDKLDTDVVINEKGQAVKKKSVAAKMVYSTLTFSMLALVIATVVCLSAIQYIRHSAVSQSTTLGQEAAHTSGEALKAELEEQLVQMVKDKADLAEAKLRTYSNATMYAADYARDLFANPELYSAREVDIPRLENGGIWAMQRLLVDESLSYSGQVKADNELLGNMEEVFTSIVERNENIVTVYIGTESGVLVSYDPYSDSAYAGGEGYYDYKSSYWYDLSKNTDSYTFTEAYEDSYGRGLTITCAAPVRDASGQFLGCVAMDILVDDLNNSMVSDGIVDPTRATLIDMEGNILAGYGISRENGRIASIWEDDFDSQIKAVTDVIFSNDNGIVSAGTDNEACYIAYAFISENNWKLCITSPVSMITGPAEEIRTSIDNNTDNVVESVVKGILNAIQSCLILTAIILILITFTVGKLSRRVSDPITQLEKDVDMISHGHLEYRTLVKTDDEIGSLAESFNNMADSLQKYIADLTEATLREQKIASELSVATDIQEGVLPKVFPAFPDKPEIDIYATMTPAKEVGGDFYDFFLIDDDHIGLVMADVSGKGVPAALFMMVGKTLIKNTAKSCSSPSKVLYQVNNQLCEGNDANLFITCWFGVLELSTGKIMAANAGHEYPAIKRADGLFEMMKDKHGFVLGAMEDMPYTNYEFTLGKGDMLFVYTDGVPEATDAQNEQFGTDRMIASLNKKQENDVFTLLPNIKKDIDDFVGEAPQFDDITMLGLIYKGK